VPISATYFGDVEDATVRRDTRYGLNFYGVISFIEKVKKVLLMD